MPEQAEDQNVNKDDESFENLPLKDFWGTLTAVSASMVTGVAPSRLKVKLDFSKLEVIESDEPYTLPTAHIYILQSNREKSEWGVFGNSIDRILNARLPEYISPHLIRGLRHCLDKRIHLRYTPQHLMEDRATKAEKLVSAWEVVEIEGEAKPTSH